MKKRQTKRLTLNRETVRDLLLAQITGGCADGCFTTTEGELCQSTACIVETNCAKVCG